MGRHYYLTQTGKGVKLVAWGHKYTILYIIIIKEKVFLVTHTSYTLYTRVLHVCRRYLSLANWGHLIHPDEEQQKVEVEEQHVEVVEEHSGCDSDSFWL